MEKFMNLYMAMGLSFMNEIKTSNERWKKRIQDEWEKSKNYPRKKKKRVRKGLLLDWSIADWSPFEF